MTDDDSHETPADQPEETQGSLVERDDGGAWYKPPEMSRREVAKWLMALSGSAAIGSIAISSVRGLSDAGLGVLQAERVYVKGTYLVNRNGDRLQIDGTLPRGEGKKMLVIPERRAGENVRRNDLVAPILGGRIQETDRSQWDSQRIRCVFDGLYACRVSGQRSIWRKSPLSVPRQ